MYLPRAAINNMPFTITIILLLTLVGLVSFLTMPRTEDPQFDLPLVFIEVIYPGASPLDLETLVVDPLEDEINKLENIKKIETQIKDGGIRLVVDFLHGTNPDDAYTEMKQAVASVKDVLPDAIQYIEVIKATPNAVAILQLALWSEPHDYKTMEIYAKQLEKRLEANPQVQKASLWGYPDQLVSIDFNMDVLKHYNIPLQQIIDTLQGRAVNITPGFVDASERRFNVKASGNFTQLGHLEQTIIAANEDAALRLKDVAKVSFGSREPTYLGYYKNKRVIFLTVEQRKKTNLFKLNEALYAEIEQFKQRLPHNIHLDTIFKQVDSVEKRVNGFFENFIQGLIVVGIMALLFLGFKDAFIVIMAVPISVLIAIGWLDFSGFGLQQMSIVGLIIALGLLVDNAIVVTESIHRFKRTDIPSLEASAHGASQVGSAVTSGTITTMFAFLPMLMLQTNTGDFMRAMPVTVVLVLLASLMVALTFTPLLASRFNYSKESKVKSFQFYTSKFAERYYTKFLKNVIRFKWVTLAIALMIFLTLASLFDDVGVSLFPKAEKPMILIDVETPPNTAFSQTDTVIQSIADKVMASTLVDNVAINVGNANPRIYYNEIPKRGLSNYGQILVLLKEYDEQGVHALIEQLRSYYLNYPEAKVLIKEFTQGPVTDKPITFRIIGDKLDDIREVANAVESKMRASEGFVSIENPVGLSNTELSLEIDYDKAALSGVDIYTLDATIAATLSGQTIGTFNDVNGEDYPIIIRQPEPKLDDLKNIYIANNSGQQLPLSSFVEPKLVNASAMFFHYQKLRMAKVSADAGLGYSVNELTLIIKDFLNKYELPAGVYFQIGGEEENRQESFSGLFQIMLITALGIIAILVLQFKSFLQPLIILSSIPFAIAGSVLGLYFFGLSFSLMAFIGLISLFGIVVNNAIILVDCTNMYIAQGKEKLDAILSASATRFTPIILTTLTTIGGLIPLTVLGGSLWKPLGLVIISGLIISTFSSLLLVPVLTSLLTRKKANQLPL